MTAELVAETTATPPDEYAAQFMADIYQADMTRERSRLSDAHHLGVSDLGVCREKARRTLLGFTPTDAPPRWRAVLGTWVDAGFKEALAASRPHLILDPEVHCELPSGLVLLGHPDIVDPLEPSVTDGKTKDEAGLYLVEATGSVDTHRMARHVYTLGAMQEGLIEGDATARNIYLDRSGRREDPYVEQEPFDPTVVEQADSWMGDVLYSIAQDEEASKDPHFSWCKQFCEHFTACRLNDASEQGFYTDDEIVKAASAHLTAKAEEKRAGLVLKGASAVLNENEVNGVAGEVRVRRSWTNSDGKSCKCGCGQRDGFHTLHSEAL